MIRIGDFSKLSRVSIKTLRYYDEVGLLKPVQVDPLTGYRLYDYSQLSILNRILTLKELGFSLEEIGRLLDGNLSVEQLRGMFKLREAESRQRIQEETDRLARVEARLRQLEQESIMSKYDIVIKHADTIRIASVRGVVPTPPDQGRLWRDLDGYLAIHRVKPAGPCFSLYHDEDYKEIDWDIEVCEPITSALTESAKVKVRDLPVVESMACTVHHGSFKTISDAYDALIKWIGENGYHVSGPAREIYLRPAANGSQTDPNTVTEIQFPVAKE